jgi:cytochrome c peroxidase
MSPQTLGNLLSLLFLGTIPFSSMLLMIGIYAQEPERPTPTHLVGHEEIALLERVQDVIDDWDPREFRNPYVETSEAIDENGRPIIRKNLRRPDLAEFIADPQAAEALGKAFFWEMQAGSDFRCDDNGTEKGLMIGTACASCHFRHGADSRDRHTTRPAFVAWNEYELHDEHPLEFGESQQVYLPLENAVKQVPWNDFQPGAPFSLIVGSQGVDSRDFVGLNPSNDIGPGWLSEVSTDRKAWGSTSTVPWAMFSEKVISSDGISSDGRQTRQITDRNAPTVINQAFSDRLFHDGRAESTFNGFSIFGDRDHRKLIYRAERTPIPTAENPDLESLSLIPVRIAIVQAALASQAVGPIVNDVEMSFHQRTFLHVARKLLPASVLGYQTVAEDDSILGPYDRRLLAEQLGNGVQPEDLKRLVGPPQRSSFTYQELIKKAFRREWWDDGKAPASIPFPVGETTFANAKLIENNFSLFWGLSLMLYEAQLLSTESPFDGMMRGDPSGVDRRWQEERERLGDIYLDRFPNMTDLKHETGTAVFQHGFRVFMNRGCIECHSGPFFSEVYERNPEFERPPTFETLNNTLLSNANTDAIAIERKKVFDRTQDQIIRLLVNTVPAWQRNAALIASRLDLLREQARGDQAKLEGLIEKELKLIAGAPEDDQPLKVVSIEIATLLLNFEQHVSLTFWNRRFFNEEQRIDAAAAIAEPLLVESMPIPPSQLPTRPTLPERGGKIPRPYAFYDLGFYNLGVAPPRYDRGIGSATIIQEKSNLTLPEIRAISEAFGDPEIANWSRGIRSAMEIYSEDDTEEAVNQFKAQLRQVSEKQQQVEQGTSGGRGEAYRFRSEWRLDRPAPTIPLIDDKGNSLNPQALMPQDAQLEATPQAINGLDNASPVAAEDRSWDRGGLVASVRRSDHAFLSRARELVVNEEPWGFRKPFLGDDELSFWGAFRTPTLRNVELTAPYMHNGRFMNLEDVIEFYAHEDPNHFIPRDLVLNPDKHPEIVPLDFGPYDQAALHFFLICLTDDRVRRESAPFDHPSLELVNGYSEVEPQPKEQTFHLEAVGNSGRSAASPWAPKFPSNH